MRFQISAALHIFVRSEIPDMGFRRFIVRFFLLVLAHDGVSSVGPRSTASPRFHCSALADRVIKRACMAAFAGVNAKIDSSLFASQEAPVAPQWNEPCF